MPPKNDQKSQPSTSEVWAAWLVSPAGVFKVTGLLVTIIAGLIYAIYYAISGYNEIKNLPSQIATLQEELELAKIDQKLGCQVNAMRIEQLATALVEVNDEITWLSEQFQQEDVVFEPRNMAFSDLSRGNLKRLQIASANTINNLNSVKQQNLEGGDQIATDVCNE